jgi:hypothetical protein
VRVRFPPPAITFREISAFRRREVTGIHFESTDRFW